MWNLQLWLSTPSDTAAFDSVMLPSSKVRVQSDWQLCSGHALLVQVRSLSSNLMRDVERWQSNWEPMWL
jgi:hypothetical protein